LSCPTSLYDPANPGDCTIICISLPAPLAAKFKEEILAVELGDDAAEVLLRAEAFPFEQLHNGRDLSHIGNGRSVDAHGFTFGAVVTHG
jgi:hypothetical protein